MPTILAEAGFAVRILTLDHPPAHVHGFKAGETAKIEIADDAFATKTYREVVLDLAVDYARQRETFGKKIAERQAIAFKLAEMATDLEAARRLVRHAATTWEDTGHAPMEAAMAKLFASEMLQRVKDKGIEKRGLLSPDEFKEIVEEVLVAKR